MKKLKIALVALMGALMLTSCDQASRTSQNISNRADMFEVTRRIAVINTRSDKPILDLIGNFSIKNSTENELEIIVDMGDGVYKKHYVYLNQWVTYVVEDLSGADVSPYKYEIHYIPEMIIPFEVEVEQ